MAGNRFRHVDYWHFRHLKQDQATAKAADEIIASPEKHLLTQDQLWDAEGGTAGFAAQLGVSAVGLTLLFAARPKLLTYLKYAQLRAQEWTLLGGVAIVSYRVGYNLSVGAFGDSQKVKNHWLAYFYQKQLNRFEGRQILTKAPKTY
jgi:hypothetical protein